MTRGGPSTGFSGDAWHVINAFQTNDITAPYNYQQTRLAYDLVPTKPILHAEPRYEPHSAKQDGTSPTVTLNRRFKVALFGVDGRDLRKPFRRMEVWQGQRPGTGRRRARAGPRTCYILHDHPRLRRRATNCGRLG